MHSLREKDVVNNFCALTSAFNIEELLGVSQYFNPTLPSYGNPE